jgi:hypothetical protein
VSDKKLLRLPTRAFSGAEKEIYGRFDQNGWIKCA